MFSHDATTDPNDKASIEQIRLHLSPSRFAAEIRQGRDTNEIGRHPRDLCVRKARKQHIVDIGNYICAIVNHRRWPCRKAVLACR